MVIQYRPEIDGLRAVAVLSVILFHSGIGVAAGGYVGVDVFFVISGYLIASIILAEISAGRFSLLRFYERRARRILPALLLVTIVATIPAWVVLLPVALHRFGDSVIGVATFTSNFVFWRQQGYFEESSEWSPLIHTWSLGVEEQFYIVFPFLLLLMSRLRRELMFAGLLLCVLGSLALSIWAVDYQSQQKVTSAAFFLLPFRAWELGIGALIAIHQQGQAKFVASRKIGDFLAAGGLGLIVYATLTLDSDSSFPGLSAAVPAIGSALVIVGAGSGTRTARCLSAKPVVFIGLISYSLYLWHQVLMAYWRNVTGRTDFNGATIIGLLGASLALSYLSFRFVEKPFRNKNFLKGRTILGLGAAGLLFVAGVGKVTKQAVKHKEELLAFELSKGGYVYFQNMDERKFMRARLQYDLPDAEAVVMGSSRIMQVGSEELGKSVLNLGVSGASVEDYVSFVPEAIKKVGAHEVYLGADPWLFNENARQERWRSVEGMYRYWSRFMEGCGSILDARSYMDSEGAGERNQIWTTRLYRMVNRRQYWTDNARREEVAKKRFDGFHVYDRRYATKSEAAIEKGFRSILDYSMRNYAMDGASRREYVRLIDCLKRSGMRVVLVLSPYHPRLFEIMREERPEFLRAEMEFRTIAERMGVKIVGSYNGASVGCGAREFYDGMHPRESCMRKVMNEAVAGAMKE